ncbi:hypothetical protein G5V57_20045 [Nordella sp. HKS 07]|uniref:hypothetical protein n=1 Tax=Nordella sp. HKS 07 TaxID=2712222 RepID=UPI0013E18E17|nr:hypothetical protein [Nordella sp. HKS 07]QIG49808.1 hypothetical protein G5V57_20045 [Nordella sp. HKS 07]
MATSGLTTARIVLPRITRHGSAGSPFLWHAAVAFLTLFVLLYAGTFFDDRLFNGVSVWEKPAKFFLSLSLHMATLAWGLALLPAQERQTPAIRMTSIIVVAAAIGEVIYITFRAARGEASHFNETTVIASAFYMLMGVGAVTLSVTTSFLGWRILRRAPDSSLAFATGLGFMLSGVLATLSGAYMSEQGARWVGGDLTDATGLPFFHWSTTGGDLRVAHFFGLHIMQALPVLGFLFRDFTRLQARGLIALGAILWTGLTVLTFFQAIAGRPFIAP